MTCRPAVVIGVCVVILGSPCCARCDDPPPRDERLRAELLDRAEKDQKARKRYIELQGHQGGKDADAVKKELQAAAKEMEEIDAGNTTRMKEVVDKHGWPGKSLVGTDGAQRAWLLVQHADRDPEFQKRCLPLLGEAVKKGEASPEHLAYLTDRVRVAGKEKQVYGTQFHDVDGKMEPYPIEDEANVDKRRKEIGLPSLAEYRKMIEKMYKPKPKDKGDK